MVIFFMCVIVYVRVRGIIYGSRKVGMVVEEIRKR